MSDTRALDWGDLRHFLATARAGSTLAAARELSMNQTTVARRIAALEAVLGVALFERRQAGYRPTEAGRRVLAYAERVEAEVAALVQTLAAEDRRLVGAIRATTNETMASRIVVPFLQEFRRTHPAIRVELVVDDRRLDLARGEADVALRAGPPPSEAEGGLVARRLCGIGWAVYCSRSYVERHGGAPAAPEELAAHQLIGGEGPLAQMLGQLWLEATAAGAELVCRSNSLGSLLGAVKAGLGIGALPCFLADPEPDLLRCFPSVLEIRSELWLVAREELRGAPHVRAFLDELAAHVRPMRTQLTGCP